MRIRGEQMELELVPERRECAGYAIDQPSIDGQRAVDITNQVLEADHVPPGDVQLDHWLPPRGIIASEERSAKRDDVTTMGKGTEQPWRLDCLWKYDLLIVIRGNYSETRAWVTFGPFLRGLDCLSR